MNSAAITSRGALYTWGRGAHGRLGHGTIESCLTPQPVSFNAHNIERIIDVALGNVSFSFLSCFNINLLFSIYRTIL